MKKKPIQPVEQKQSNDCGIAALAMLFDSPYSLVRNLVLQSSQEPFDGTTDDMAVTVGALLGSPVLVQRVKAQNRDKVAQTLRGRSAVLIVPAQDHKVSGDWHAVYWTGYAVLDPSPTGKYGRRGIKALKTFTEVWLLESEE